MTDKKLTSISISEHVQEATSNYRRSDQFSAKTVITLDVICAYVEELEQRIAELEKKSET